MPHAMMRAGRRLGAVVTTALSVVLLSAGGLVLAQAAQAALIDVPSTGTPGRLVLSSEPYPAEFLELSPGEPSYWQIGARLEDARSATLSLQLRKDGELVEHPRGLTMTVRQCDSVWTGLDAVPACASGERTVTVATPADDYTTSSPTFELRSLTPTTPEYFLVTLAVEDSVAAMADTSLMGLAGQMGVGLTAVSIDDVPVTPGGLARTGLDVAPLGAVAAIAVGLLGLGLAFRLARKGTRA